MCNLLYMYNSKNSNISYFPNKIKIKILKLNSNNNFKKKMKNCYLYRFLCISIAIVISKDCNNPLLDPDINPLRPNDDVLIIPQSGLVYRVCKHLYAKP